MGFYGPEPWTEAHAYYIWTDVDEAGHFIVDVEGKTSEYASGLQLVRDANFVGGLKVVVMGWTGWPSGGRRPYRVSGTFPGMFSPRIVVACKNHSHAINVEEIPETEVESFLRVRVKTEESGSFPRAGAIP
jgi:hypothetical protein